MFEFFDHTADLGLRAKAVSLDELFAQAGKGFTAMIAADPSGLGADVEAEIKIPGEELDYLLFDWLNALLDRFERESLLFRAFEVHVDASGLVAKCRGSVVDPNEFQLEHEVKAITYHGLKVEKLESGEWLAEAIVDI